MSAATPSALVLAAGLGTRLRPLTLVRAKPAAPVAGAPLVLRILRWLRAHGVGRVVLNLHHRPETITRIVGDGRALGFEVRYSWEQPILGSAGGPRRALPLLETDPFLVVNGDTLTDADLGALAAEHARTGALVTLAVVANPDPSKYGGVRVGAGGVVEGFTRAGDRTPSFHFVGVQMAGRDAFAGLDDGRPAESVTGVYQELVTGRRGAVRAWITDASFRDIGTVAEYLATSLALARQEGTEARMVGARSTVAPDATVVRSVLWDDVHVGAGCILEDTVVADGVALPAGLRLRNCAVVPAAAAEPGPGDRLAGGALVCPFVHEGARV